MNQKYFCLAGIGVVIIHQCRENGEASLGRKYSLSFYYLCVYKSLSPNPNTSNIVHHLQLSYLLSLNLIILILTLTLSHISYSTVLGSYCTLSLFDCDIFGVVDEVVRREVCDENCFAYLDDGFAYIMITIDLLSTTGTSMRKDSSC